MNNLSFRTKRLERLKSLLKEKKLDALLLYSRVNTQYFTGFTGTDSFALICAEAKEPACSHYIFLDSRYTEQGKIQCVDACRLPATNGHLNAAVEKIADLGLASVAVEAEYLPLELYLSLKEKLNKSSSTTQVEVLKSSDLSPLRYIKDEYEIACLRKAISISDQALARLLPEIKVGMTETEIAARLEYHQRMLGASGTSFTTICASGVRGALPHGIASDKKVAYGEAITLDFGCLYEGYCSDITRTIFLGKPQEEIYKIYHIVLEAQLAAEAFIRPGVLGKEAHKIAADIIAKHGYGEYFGHGLGHSLGLEIHELPSASPKSEAKFEAGMLITVEPGIYVPGLGGVRIEDTCLVTEDGLEILTSADKSVIVLEA